MQLAPSKGVAGIPNAIHSVEFFPALDDYLYVSTKLSNATSSTPATTYLYYTFLFVNAIAFPAFLWLDGDFAAGLAVFVVNLVAVLSLLPRVNTNALRTYYATLFGNRENEIARVELSQEGILYFSDGSHSFWEWHRIVAVEETQESIFFFLEGNGFGVRREGFAYRDDEKLFLAFVSEHVDQAHPDQLSE